MYDTYMEKASVSVVARCYWWDGSRYSDFSFGSVAELVEWFDYDGCDLYDRYEVLSA